LQPKPLFKELPNPHGIPAMNKKMIMVFLGLLAKLTKATILPPTPTNLSAVQSLFCKEREEGPTIYRDEDKMHIPFKYDVPTGRMTGQTCCICCLAMTSAIGFNLE
jgi:hypothetical protein